VLENQIFGLAETLIQHGLAQELKFKGLVYDSAILKDRAVHKTYSICLDEQGHPTSSVLGTTVVLVTY
jgi:hypothetical protein